MNIFKNIKELEDVGQISPNTLVCADCLDAMMCIEDKSVSMVLCDLPYQITSCRWDTIIPFEPLWEQYKRIMKDNGAIALTASQPFTSALIMSNVKMFKYEWIWNKSKGSNFILMKYQPMKEHESILIFSKKTHRYYPIMQKRNGSGANRAKRKYNVADKKEREGLSGFKMKHANNNGNNKLRFPSSVQKFNCEVGLHPTQKPVALFEYLIKTYTNEGDLVLDNCAGSGTTGVACKNLNRNYIMIEQDPEYCKIIEKRMSDLQYSGKQLSLF